MDDKEYLEIRMKEQEMVTCHHCGTKWPHPDDLPLCPCLDE